MSVTFNTQAPALMSLHACLMAFTWDVDTWLEKWSCGMNVLSSWKTLTYISHCDCARAFSAAVWKTGSGLQSWVHPSNRTSQVCSCARPPKKYDISHLKTERWRARRSAWRNSRRRRKPANPQRATCWPHVRERKQERELRWFAVWKEQAHCLYHPTHDNNIVQYLQCKQE